MMSERKAKDDSTVPFYPDHITLEAKVATAFGILLLIIGGIALWYPVGIGEPADPMITPYHTKPEWYFLFLFQLLKFVPKTVGSIIAPIGIAVLVIWPFVDRKLDTSYKNERNRLIVVIFLLAIIIALSIWGELS